MALCPYCKAEHSKYFINGKTPEPAPVHCASCGKQFMLVNGHAFKIKKEKLTTNVQPFVVPIVAPAIAAEPRILPTNSACPACGKGIPTNSIFPGLNSCPHCQAEYEAEG